MVLVLKFGQTVPNTKVSGATTKPTERANSGMPMATCMKVIGKTTRLTATESTFM